MYSFLSALDVLRHVVETLWTMKHLHIISSASQAYCTWFLCFLALNAGDDTAICLWACVAPGCLKDIVFADT